MGSRLTRKELVQLLLLILFGWGISQLLGSIAPLGRDLGADPVARAMLLDETSPSRRVAAPTLTMVVFTDYQCPGCKRANPAMEAAVARDGHVRVIYRDWPIFGPRSEMAARVAIAADRQGLYPAVHRRLMAERRQLDDAVLREAVEASGGSWARVQRELATHAAETGRRLNRNGRDALSLGIAGTPAYLVGPLLISGALDERGFARAFAAGRAVSK